MTGAEERPGKRDGHRLPQPSDPIAGGTRHNELSFQPFTDPQFVAAFDFEVKLGAYLSKGASTQTYGDSQNLFAQGSAAIFPLGSWDIAYFNQVAGLEFGVFAPPVRTAGRLPTLGRRTSFARYRQRDYLRRSRK